MNSIEQGALHLLAIHSFISIQPQRPGWQKQETSHVNGKLWHSASWASFWG